MPTSQGQPSIACMVAPILSSSQAEYKESENTMRERALTSDQTLEPAGPHHPTGLGEPHCRGSPTPHHRGPRQDYVMGLCRL
jgi:hypothetical protein